MVIPGTPLPSPTPSMRRERERRMQVVLKRKEEEEKEEEEEAEEDIEQIMEDPSNHPGHPFKRICQPMTLYVNYRRWGDSPRHPRLAKHKQLVVCACRSIPHVWGLFATQNFYASRHNPDGSVLATDFDLRSFRRIHCDDHVLTAYKPERPLWIFSVDYREHRHYQHQHQQNQNQNQNHQLQSRPHHDLNRNYQTNKKRNPTAQKRQGPPPLVSCCTIM